MIATGPLVKARVMLVISTSFLIMLKLLPSTKNDRQPHNCRAVNPAKFVSYPTCEQLNFTCSTCAFVTGSGHMIGSALGWEIDSHDCVVRPNDVSVTGYERHVGGRTTIRTVHPGSMEIIGTKLQSGRPFDHSFWNTLFVLNIFSTKHDLSVFERIAIEFKKDYPGAKIFVHTDQEISYVREVFDMEVGKSNGGYWMSNGFITLLFLKEHCGSIDVYGMAPPGYCFEGHKDVPYHYYEETGFECEVFRRNKSEHRFLKEKKVFEKWRRKWGNLKFHSPVWP